MTKRKAARAQMMAQHVMEQHEDPAPGMPLLSNEPMQRALQLQTLMMEECRKRMPGPPDPLRASWEWWKRVANDTRHLNEIIAAMMPEISRHFVPIQLQIGTETIQTWAPMDAVMKGTEAMP